MKHLTAMPEPNPRRGPLTINEYQLVEFDCTQTGQVAVSNAIVRTSERHYEQATTLPARITVTAPAGPEPTLPTRDLSRSLYQFAGTIVVLWIVAGVVLALLALVKGAGID